ncbi:glycosyltransferase family 4 protein [uncultured Winogradskyella sp.]|uniref:glycosyltransferase family 4 protein n=1 Tax=Winogradskyella sp. 4-2091 TaxID=3381659 RepID=UPI00261D134A|nr:glycosyltransferase family 4 protein [uncultured Winogradskyella sp.]
MSKTQKKTKIILGPFKKDNHGSISLLNTVFKNNLDANYEVIRFFTDRNKGKTSLSKLNFYNIVYFLKQQLDLIRLVRKLHPQIFHFSIHSFWSMEKSLVMIAIAKLFGTEKTIAHLHGGSFESFWINMNPIRRKIARIMFKNVDMIIVASTYWKFFFEENGFKNQIKIVNNPIDEEFVKAIEKVKGTHRNSDFLFVGSLGKRKGTYDLLKVAELNKDFSLVLIGNSEETGDFEKVSNIIEQHKLSNVKLIRSDKLSLKDKVKYFSESGCFIFPSYTENFPLVIIEAAAAGMPIISTKVGAVPEFFGNRENILFVEAGNIQLINEAIITLEKNKDFGIELGKNARTTYVNKLALPLIINQLHNAYKTLLN